MNRPLIILAAVMLLGMLYSGTAVAFDAVKIEAAGVSLDLGYRLDQLDWSISGDSNGENINVLSELNWKDIKILQLQVGGWLELKKLPFLNRNSLVLANLSFGKIISGTVQDSDYAADNRTYEWSRSVNDAGQGTTVDLSVAFGPLLKLRKVKELTVTPLVGYGFNMQALTMTNGKQVISDPIIRQSFFGSSAKIPPAVGEFPGLDSSYTAYWYGPWLGVNVDYMTSEKFILSLGMEYHRVEYFAQADWNLRSDFAHPVSFEHEASGAGVVWNVKGRYQLCDNWSLSVSGKFQYWETRSGSDRIFFTAGSVGKTHLNQVNWDSYALMTGIHYQF